MSKLVNDNYFGQTAHLMYTDDDKVGTFQILQGDVHGNVLHFTDYSGADNCIRCIERNLIEALEEV
mgnify:FL=1